MPLLLTALNKLRFWSTPLEKMQSAKATFEEVKGVLIKLESLRGRGRIIKVAAYLKGTDKEELNGKMWRDLHHELTDAFKDVPTKQRKMYSKFSNIFNGSLIPGGYNGTKLKTKLIVAMGVIDDLIKLVNQEIYALQPVQQQMAA